MEASQVRGQGKVKRTRLIELLSLRMAILRPDEEDDSWCIYPNDWEPDAWHYRVIHDGASIGMVSLLRDRKRFSPNLEAQWRVRGLGVLDLFRGRGYARLLLERAVTDAQTGARLPLWGSARLDLISLYESFGAHAIGDCYEIRGTGVHRDVVIESPSLPSLTLGSVL